MCTFNCSLLTVLVRSCKVSAFFESHNGKRMPLRGEGGEYSLEVVRHDPDNRGESELCFSTVHPPLGADSAVLA
jgi:hypothetical protein